MDSLEITLIIAIVLIGGVVLFGIYHLVDVVLAKHGGVIKATVHHKAYTPESTSTGVGPAFGNGVSVAVVSSHRNEEWTLIVKYQSGEIEAVECSKKVWAAHEVGDSVSVSYDLGFFTKNVVNKEVVY